MLLCNAIVTIFDPLEELEKSNSIQVFSFFKDLISVRRQNNPDFLNQLNALHQSPEIELKNIDFILRKENDLSSITANIRPQRPSKRARNAQKNDRHFLVFVSPASFPLLYLRPDFIDWWTSQQLHRLFYSSVYTSLSG